MKNLVLIVLVICSTLEAKESSNVELKLKNKAVSSKVEILSFNKETTVYVENKIEYSVKNNEIEYIKNINKEDTKFKKTVILTNKQYYSGTIIYQDRRKVSIEVEGNLESFRNEDIVDIVSVEDFLNEKSRSSWKSLGYSCLLPGLGQFYSNRYVAGSIISSTFLFSSTSSAYFYVKAKDNWKQYESEDYRNLNTYNTYKNSMYLHYGFLSISILIYLYNIIDAYYNFSYKYQVLNVQRDEKVSLYQSDDGQYRLAFNYKF